MKRLKKLLAVLVTMITVIAMAVPVSVSADDTYSVTITANDEGTHTYSAYQIFSGTLSENGSTLSDIVWGSGVDSTAISDFIAALKADPTIGTDMTDVSTAADVAAVLADYDTDSDKLKAFAAVVRRYLTASPTASETGEGAVTISGLSAGYYLITDSLDSGSGAESATILEVVGDVKITSKSDLPSVTKEAGTETAAIGDTISYTITGTLSSTFANYLSGGSAYSYTLTDTMADCLDLVYTEGGTAGTVVSGVTVMMDGTNVTGSFTITYSNFAV